MKEGSERIRMNDSDRLIETIQKASSNMNFDEYAQATGLDKEFLFRILKGEIEMVDDEVFRKLSLKH